MIARILPHEEWPKLDGTLLATIWRTLDPAFAEVLVVEDGDQIVGSAALLMTLHVECLAVPNVSVGRALWTLLQTRVKAAGGQAVWGAALERPMRRLLERHGDPIPGDHFLMRV